MLKDFKKILLIIRSNFASFKYQSGLTLVEVMAVLMIISIITGIAAPSVMGVVQKTKQEACNISLSQIERMYKVHLNFQGIEHSEVFFSQYLHEYGENSCSIDCEITYMDGKVQCSDDKIVEDDTDNENGDNKGVPFL